MQGAPASQVVANSLLPSWSTPSKHLTTPSNRITIPLNHPPFSFILHPRSLWLMSMSKCFCLSTAATRRQTWHLAGGHGTIGNCSQHNSALQHNNATVLLCYCVTSQRRSTIMQLCQPKCSTGKMPAAQLPWTSMQCLLGNSLAVIDLVGLPRGPACHIGDSHRFCDQMVG